MAKGKSSFENMGAGLFDTSPNISKVQSAPSATPSLQSSVDEPNSGMARRKAGKPKDDDLKETEKTIPTIVQLTPETKYAIDKYVLEQGYKSRSQAIREIIRNLQTCE